MKGVQNGIATLTGANVDVEVGFRPKYIELSSQGRDFFWFSHPMDSSLPISTTNPDTMDGKLAIMNTGTLYAATEDFLLGFQLPTIGTTDTQIANVQARAMHGDDSTSVAQDIPATAAGTALTATTHDITAGGYWASYHLISDGGTESYVMSASVYSTEAAAIAALGAVTADNVSLGFVTVQSTSGAIFDATTDALAGGTTGTPANATNYYYGCGIMANGITGRGVLYGDTSAGFRIGTSTLINVANRVVKWTAYRS